MILKFAILLLCLSATGATNAPVTIPAIPELPAVSVVFEEEPTNIVAWKARIDAQRAIEATNKPPTVRTYSGTLSWAVNTNYNGPLPAQFQTVVFKSLDLHNWQVATNLPWNSTGCRVTTANPTCFFIVGYFSFDPASISNAP